jgi:glycosyltransferase involved in cell wall biosynthesis
MTFSVMITTRNRCADLRRTGERLLSLNPQPMEILVCADGCTDDTVAMLLRDFPTFTVWENSPAQGSVSSRDRLMRLAKGDVVVSLDDDSYPVNNDFFAQLAPIMEAHPEVAVITFPELRDGDVFASPGKTFSAAGHYVSAYPNCAAAMRREFYLNQPGFPKFFIHMYEETDYALQCYAGSAAVWFEPSLVIRHHLSSVQRQFVTRHHQNARNELWSVWLRCPWPQLPIVSLFRIWRQFRYASTEGWGWSVREPLWWVVALGGLIKCYQNRKPICWPVYYAWMRLARNPIFSFAALQKEFEIKPR